MAMRQWCMRIIISPHPSSCNVATSAPAGAVVGGAVGAGVGVAVGAVVTVRRLPAGDPSSADRQWGERVTQGPFGVPPKGLLTSETKGARLIG